MSPSNSSYRRLADVYDHLMTDAPYDQWMSFTGQAWDKYGSYPRTVAELGCGTGSLTRFLLEREVEVWAVDLSADMLDIAQEKVKRSHPNAAVHWLNQDIRQLMLPTKVDSVVSFCDTLNYIPDAEGIKQIFADTYEALKPGGTFLFDVHTPYKIAEVFGDESFSYQDEKVAYIWQSMYDEENEVVEHDLTLFVEGEDGLYRRFQELHRQRAYSLEHLQIWLQEVGFEILSVTADFTDHPVDEESERAFFVARKP
ncbi:class I SAM-dependent DNA methyltransferase [Aneurinibacillus sp. REN35]|uniref:class I SAM-dependent DNA methyltransferase n=1 Tax=Aneurinibacillus sp. REN35 TaxID=3237286 RepID=UPI003527FF45